MQIVASYVVGHLSLLIDNLSNRHISMTKYKCHSCGQEHDQWPALIYNSPIQYNQLNNEEKENNGRLGNDFCIIHSEDQTDRFIRCTLTQKIIDHCADLKCGIWVSLSEKSYQDYYDNFENDNHLTEYFGWFCSSLNGYEDTLHIPHIKAGK